MLGKQATAFVFQPSLVSVLFVNDFRHSAGLREKPEARHLSEDGEGASGVSLKPRHEGSSREQGLQLPGIQQRLLGIPLP